MIIALRCDAMLGVHRCVCVFCELCVHVTANATTGTMNNRISVGVSSNGMMSGPSGANSNVMIADFSNAAHPVDEYDMIGYASSQIVLNSSPGVSNASAYQTASTSVMRWSRLANNGDANDAQISLVGVSNVVWAIGLSNAYGSVPLPPMGSTIVDLSGVASATSSRSRSKTASVSKTPKYVAPSQSPAPSVVSFAHSALLSTGLTLSWNRVDDRFDFEAVYAGLAW